MSGYRLCVYDMANLTVLSIVFGLYSDAPTFSVHPPVNVGMLYAFSASSWNCFLSFVNASPACFRNSACWWYPWSRLLTCFASSESVPYRSSVTFNASFIAKQCVAASSIISVSLQSLSVSSKKWCMASCVSRYSLLSVCWQLAISSVTTLSPSPVASGR